jgi:hypothetical protein
LPGEFPEEIDRLALLYVPLGDPTGFPYQAKRAGYYQGRFQGSNQNGTRTSGTLRGLVSATGEFFFWLEDDNGHSLESLLGGLVEDTVMDAILSGQGGYRASAEHPPLFFGGEEHSDSLTITIPFGQHTGPLQDTTCIRTLSLSRSPGSRWDPL